MKRKIVGIFIIALLTISYMPIITSEASQAPESYESKGGDIKFFFAGMTSGYGGQYESYKGLLADFGIYVDINIQFMHVEEGNFFLVDGKIIQLEAPCFLELHNFSGIGMPFRFHSFMGFLTRHLFPGPHMWVYFAGSCESYEIENVTGMAT